MIRNIVLLDGTWNTPRDVTNICKLSRDDSPFGAFIRENPGGVRQNIGYFNGVGTDGFALEKMLGGAAGIGLRGIVQDAYNWVIDHYADDQELYIYGFSRGAYAARALAGLIGACGIPKSKDKGVLDIVRANAKARRADDTSPPTGEHLQKSNRIKLLGVFDTVGSYGVPAGFSGLAPLARYVSLAVFGGFKDTKLGAHVDHALHAIAVDERRRPFTPTFWTIEKGKPHPANIEQVWFPGVHCNVGGGYEKTPQLENLALIWMIARTTALTGLVFDEASIRSTIVQLTDIDGAIPDSAEKYVIDQNFPKPRVMFSSEALAHGYFLDSGDAAEEHVNERVHWSVLAKLGRKCSVYGKADTPYDPPNLKEAMARLGPGLGGRIAAITPEEQALLPKELASLGRVSA